MLEDDSRYAELPTATIKDSEDRVISYTRRRFLTPIHQDIQSIEITVSEGDRLDSLAAQFYDDPLQFWKLCDANEAMDPFSLTETVGRTLRVPRADALLNENNLNQEDL